jgi:hypothetical protein
MSTIASKSLHIFAVSHKPNTMQGHNVNNKKGRKRCQRPKSREETPKEGCGTPKRYRIKNIFRIAIRLKGQIVAAPSVSPQLAPGTPRSPHWCAALASDVAPAAEGVALRRVQSARSKGGLLGPGKARDYWVCGACCGTTRNQALPPSFSTSARCAFGTDLARAASNASQPHTVGKTVGNSKSEAAKNGRTGRSSVQAARYDGHPFRGPLPICARNFGTPVCVFPSLGKHRGLLYASSTSGSTKTTTRNINRNRTFGWPVAEGIQAFKQPKERLMAVSAILGVAHSRAPSDSRPHRFGLSRKATHL